jgi:lysine 2,3-aminomutase
MIRTDEPNHHELPAAPGTLEHRQLRDGEFWRGIPSYAQIDEATFLDHVWQGRHSVKTPDELFATVAGIVDPGFVEDARAGFALAPMAVRVSPYLLASIDWSQPYTDPIRQQFIPLRSTVMPDHPRLTLDSLHEQEDSPVPGLIHRYADRVLFLPVQTCPVYCRFCTRSYAIGPDTEGVDKLALGQTPAHWQAAFDYIASRPEIEDIVISGGDAYQLSPRNITLIGDTLLAIPHVRRMRYATKGIGVMPMKVLTDHAWTDALTGVVERGRKMGKDVVVHTHVNHPNEITDITRRAMDVLFQRGVLVRNQTVLIRGVNDDNATMTKLVKRLEWVNIHPYYVYMHDLVRGDRDRHREARARRDVGVQHAGVHHRRARRRRQARRPLLRALRPRERNQRVHRAERETRTALSVLRSDRFAGRGCASALGDSGAPGGDGRRRTR